MQTKADQKDKPVVIRTPDHRLRVFVSSTLKELAPEREAARSSQNMPPGQEQAQRLSNAVRLLGTIPALYHNSHMFFWVGWLEIYERVVVKIREIAGEQVWTKAYAEGQMLSMPQAVTLALHELQRHNHETGSVLAHPGGKDGI